jgi:hypothetical protein
VGQKGQTCEKSTIAAGNQARSLQPCNAAYKTLEEQDQVGTMRSMPWFHARPRWENFFFLRRWGFWFRIVGAENDFVAPLRT